MPIYEYRCKECSHVTSFLEKSKTEGLHACEKCGSEETEKQFSSFAARSGQAQSKPSCADGGCCTGSCPFS